MRKPKKRNSYMVPTSLFKVTGDYDVMFPTFVTLKAGFRVEVSNHVTDMDVMDRAFRDLQWKVNANKRAAVEGVAPPYPNTVPSLIPAPMFRGAHYTVHKNGRFHYGEVYMDFGEVKVNGWAGHARQGYRRTFINVVL